MMRWLVCITFSFLFLTSSYAANPAADLESRRKALNDLLDEQWEYTLQHNPFLASILGDKRYNDQIDDFSQEAIDDNSRPRAPVSAAHRSHRHHRVSRSGSSQQAPDDSRSANGS